jgi:hypothetical protein
MAARQLSDGNDAGTVIGQSSTDLVAFYGATPVDQAAVVTNTSGTLGNTNSALTAVINALTSIGILAAS